MRARIERQLTWEGAVAFYWGKRISIISKIGHYFYENTIQGYYFVLQLKKIFYFVK